MPKAIGIGISPIFNALSGISCVIVDSISGVIAHGSTYVHTTNCHIKLTITSLPATTSQIRFRRQSDTNFLRLAIQDDGGYVLAEIVDGASNTLASAASGTFSADDVVHITVYNNTITVFANTSQVCSVTSSVHADETGGEILLGLAVLSDLESWTYGCPAEDSDIFT